MSFVLNLPEAVCVDVLSRWCRLKDICTLDSAVCNQTERNDLLSLFRDPGFVIGDLIDFIFFQDTSRMNMSYLMKRQIKMLKLKYTYSNEADHLLLKMDRSQVVTLTLYINHSSKAWMQQFVKPMKHLTSLFLAECPSGGGKNVIWKTLSDLNRLAQLTQIEVFDTRIITDSDMTLLATHCRHLQKIIITFNRKVCDNTMFELLNKNNKLRHLQLSSMPLITGAILPLLAECCKSLEYVNLLISHKFDWVEVVNLLTECVHLRFCSVGTKAKHHENCCFTLLDKIHGTNVKVLILSQDYDNQLWRESDLHLLLSVVRGCDEICIQHVQSLSRRCLEMISDNNPQLKALRIYNAPTITADDLISLIDHCPLLVDLSVPHCWGVNKEQLVEKTATRNIKVVWDYSFPWY